MSITKDELFSLTKDQIENYSNAIINCDNCINCNYCTKCKYCIKCSNCISCINCIECSNCLECKNCFKIICGTKLQYVALGVQLTKVEYEEFMKRLK
jgi:hypothetical protein